MGSDQGIRLMNIDGQIAERLINVYTAARIPILCIHDSFIVPYTHAHRLKRSMANVARGRVGHELEVDSEGFGLDETGEWSEEHREFFIATKQRPRSEGYLERWKGFERLKGSKG